MQIIEHFFSYFYLHMSKKMCIFAADLTLIAMKRYFPLISLLVLGCAVLGLNACGGNEPEPQKANLTITPDAIRHTISSFACICAALPIISDKIR